MTLTFDHTWPWPWIFMVKFWNSCISEWEGRLTMHKGGGSRSFMTMTMTIWGPRSGVWIYQIVTGVTSVVGVPSTHLVLVWQPIKFKLWLCESLFNSLWPSGVMFYNKYIGSGNGLLPDSICHIQGPLLQTLFNFNPIRDKWSHVQ